MAQNVEPGHKSGGLLWFHLAALFAVTAWGQSFISTRVLLDNGLGPVQIYVLRSTVAYAFLLAISLKNLRSNSWADEALLMLCGMCAGSIYFITENTAMEYTLVSNVALITSLAPLLTALFLGMLYRNERPTRGTWIGSAVAIVGVACVIFNSSVSLEVNPLGDLLAFLAAISWAIYSILLRRLNVNYSGIFITRKVFFYGVITALPFLIFEPNDAPLSVLQRPAVFGNLLFLSLVASLAAFLIWAIVIKRLGAVIASNYLYVSPIVTLVAAWLVLGEKISLMGYTGCALIIGGLWVGERINRADNLSHRTDRRH